MRILIVSLTATLVVGFLLSFVALHGSQAADKDYFRNDRVATPVMKDYFNKAAETADGTRPETAEAEFTPDGAENAEEETLDPNISIETPGFASQRSGPNISNAQRCVEYAPKFDALRQKICAEVDVPKLCSLWDRESDMRLGATRGEPCRVSSAGAKGCTQFTDDTAITWGRDGDGDGRVDLQNLEDAMASALNYLCYLKKRVGEQYMYQAYQAGPKNYINPNPANFSPTAVEYDAYIRGHAQIYAAALEGKMDLTMPTSGTMVLGGISVPVPIGECWISSVFGEPRPRRHGTHEGMDMACPTGTKVMAITECKVVFAGEHNTDAGKKAGIQVQCAHGNGAAGTLALSWYFHLNSVTVKTGDIVKAGQQIGTVGTSGTFSTGPHLHLTTYLWTGSGNKTTLCQFPGIWFPTIPFLPNASNGRYKGPQTPGAKYAAARFEKMFATR